MICFTSYEINMFCFIHLSKCFLYSFKSVWSVDFTIFQSSIVFLCIGFRPLSNSRTLQNILQCCSSVFFCMQILIPTWVYKRFSLQTGTLKEEILESFIDENHPHQLDICEHIEYSMQTLKPLLFDFCNQYLTYHLYLFYQQKVLTFPDVRPISGCHFGPIFKV